MGVRTKFIERAGWRRFFMLLGVYIAYSVWAFVLAGPWRRVTEATSDGPAPEIPELMFGFPDGQPAAALNALAGVMNDYMLVQLIDVPNFLIAAAFTATGIAIGLRRFGLTHSPASLALLAPLTLVIAEAVENILLLGVAAGLLPASSALIATLQQSATSVKFVADGVGTLALVIALVWSLGAALFGLFRKKNKQ